MTGTRVTGNAGESMSIDTNLVEYVIVSMPQVGDLSLLAPPLGRLVQDRTLRVLDLVAVETTLEGSVQVIEPEYIPGLAALAGSVGIGDGILSERDLLLASTVVRPGSAAIIVVVEDLWARRLSNAAKRAGGNVIAGERIPQSRLEAALARVSPGKD
ncbi:MAG TPA: DUF6325 family protein [Nocardioidaceae bacterium]|jgi:hypothetical protein